MATMMRPNRLFSHFSDNKGSQVRRHPVLGALGLVVIVLGVIGLVSILPDIYRYARMKTM